MIEKCNNNIIESLESELLKFDQVETPLTHKFSDGVYLREIFMPANSIIIGHEHKTEHFNIVLSGKAKVLIDGEISLISAPDTFISNPGVRKVLYIIEDMKWATVHRTNETNIEKLEEELIVKSQSYKDYNKLQLEIKNLIESEL